MILRDLAPSLNLRGMLAIFGKLVDHTSHLQAALAYSILDKKHSMTTLKFSNINTWHTPYYTQDFFEFKTCTYIPVLYRTNIKGIFIFGFWTVMMFCKQWCQHLKKQNVHTYVMKSFINRYYILVSTMYIMILLIIDQTNQILIVMNDEVILLIVWSFR